MTTQWFNNCGMRLIILLFALLGTATSVLAASHEDIIPALIREGISSAPRIDVARARLKAARISIQSARWQYWPTPSLSIETVDASKTDINYSSDSTVTVFSIQQPLWTAGRLRANLHHAKAQANIRNALLKEAQLELALEIVATYGRWFSAWFKHAAWQRSLERHEQVRDQVQRRIAAGISRRSDIELAKERLESVRADMTIAAMSRKTALLQLGQLLGRPVMESSLTQQLANFQQQHQLVELPTAITQAEQIAPSLHRTLEEAHAARIRLQERKSQFWPEFFVRLEHQNGNFSNATISTESRVFLGLQSRWGAGLSTVTQVGEASAMLSAAHADIQAQRLIVRERVQNIYTVFESANQQHAIIQRIIESASQVLESYKRQFLVGTKQLADLMNAGRELALSELQLADADTARLTSGWQLIFYTQGLSHIVSAD